METYFREILRDQLVDTEESRSMKEQQLQAIFRTFEQGIKRNFNGLRMDESEYFDFLGLKGDCTKGFSPYNIEISRLLIWSPFRVRPNFANITFWNRKLIASWFQESIKGILDLIHHQIEACHEKECRIQVGPIISYSSTTYLKFSCRKFFFSAGIPNPATYRIVSNKSSRVWQWVFLLTSTCTYRGTICQLVLNLWTNTAILNRLFPGALYTVPLIRETAQDGKS